MTHFIKQGNTFLLASESMLNIHDKLPARNYTVKINDFKQYYLEEIDSFTMPSKLYGDTEQKATRIINTFNSRTQSTGVLMTGEKGSGKTLLTKRIAMKCAEQGVPAIIINTNFCGDPFNTFIQSIDQPCMILFDEFEKVYKTHEQESILTLLDGVFPSKKLFALTCNNKWQIDEHMRNRPGRIFYMLDFHGLEIKFIEEYCNDVLNDKEQIPSICRISSMFSEFNFDMLKALCEEMNRYNETAQEAIKMLNAKPQEEDGGKYKISLKVDGKILPIDEVNPKVWHGNPIVREEFTVGQVPPGTSVNEDEDYPDDDYLRGLSVAPTSNEKADSGKSHKFTYLHLNKVDPTAGTFTYTNDTGTTVTFTKIQKIKDFHAF